MRWIRNGSVLALIVLLACGCGGDGLIKARGRILKNGVPFRLGEGEGLRIVFVPMEASGTTFETYAAIYDNQNGLFTVAGKDGKGLPPGQYRITLEHLKKKEDLFKGAFSGDRTPLTCEVVNGSQEIVLDLDKAATEASSPRKPEDAKR